MRGRRYAVSGCVLLLAAVAATTPAAGQRGSRTALRADPIRPVPSHAPAGPAAPAISFRNHVIPVLTKAGCNSGACHGAAAGKNGFALTLRGYDPAADYDTITRHAAGRRVNKLEPAKSLFLLKPTETVPHVGGKRFAVGSAEYDVLAGWIASGLPGPDDRDPRLDALEVRPADRTLTTGDSLALQVTARYSNGTREDVTRWTRFASADETVARVDEDGRVTIAGAGETAISASFLTGVALTRVRAPFSTDVPPAAFDTPGGSHGIDALVLAKLRELGLPPSPPASDSAFLRRAYLDAAGILPTADEAREFLADRSPDKRSRVIDRLLERPEFVDYWTYKWSDLLLVSSRSLGASNVKAFYGWIREAVAANTPWDRFVYELTTATGRTDEVGAANYFLIHRSPIDLAENYTQAFLGLTLTCARCHNHPMEKWTQVDYYGFANLFARVSVKHGAAVGAKADVATVFSTPSGDILHPRLGVALPPRPLDGRPMDAAAGPDRRDYLARWLTSPDNAAFARTLVNRVWANFLGRGIVHPVDDLRFSNPASNEPLFEALTDRFVRSGFDVKELIREIMMSDTYQRASHTVPGNAADDRFYSHYLPRRLPAEVILDAFSQVTGVPESFEGYAAGTRALQLPDTRVESYFLSVFGRPERVVTSAAERMQDPTLPQALHAINGDTLNRKLRDDEGVLARLVKEGRSDAEILEALYLSAFSRPPSASERQALLARMAGGSGTAEPRARRQMVEDLAWAVLTSTEFLFTH